MGKRPEYKPPPIAKDSLWAVARTRIVKSQLIHLFGEFEPTRLRQLWRLYPEDVDQLALDLLSFKSEKDLIAWFKQNPPGKYRPSEDED